MKPTETEEASLKVIAETQAFLLKAAAEYTHNPTPQAVLDPFKEAILTLRAKFASYEIVTDMLTKQKVKVSIATVRRFCRRNNREIKRIREEYLAQKLAATAAASAEQPPSNPPSENNNPTIENLNSTKPIRDLRGPV